MTRTHAATYASLAERLVSLGMVSAANAREVLDYAVDRQHEELTGEDLAYALVDFEVAFAVPADSVDGVEGAYDSVLQDAAECTGGAMTIDDVTLTSDADGRDVLRFSCNGALLEWWLQHDWDNQLDHLGIWENMSSLDPGDGRTFHAVAQDETGDSFYVLATDEQVRVLTEEFGLRLDSDED